MLSAALLIIPQNYLFTNKMSSGIWLLWGSLHCQHCFFVLCSQVDSNIGTVLHIIFILFLQNIYNLACFNFVYIFHVVISSSKLGVKCLFFLMGFASAKHQLTVWGDESSVEKMTQSGCQHSSQKRSKPRLIWLCLWLVEGCLHLDLGNIFWL